MTLRVTPWGKDNFKATSEEAEAKDWAYWQNRLNRASLVMLAEEGIIKGDVASRIAAAQKHSEDLQNQPDKTSLNRSRKHRNLYSGLHQRRAGNADHLGLLPLGLFGILPKGL